MKRLFMLSTLLTFPFWLFAQNTITGMVHGENGDVLPGVTVLIKGTTTGTTTDAEGYFEISAQRGDVLEFRFVGYQSKAVTVGNEQNINVTLATSQRELSQVVVTALGISRQKRELGYSSQEVSGEELNASHQSSLVNALQGRAAGVTVSSAGGGPGQGSSILIRGVNSLDPNRNNQPLFVIDGIPIDNSTFTTGSGRKGTNAATGVQMPDRASDIDPEDIASVNILRGGAATALYGLRGANGVIVITTKSGQAGKFRVNYTATYSFDQVNKLPDVQNKYTQGSDGEYKSTSFWPAWGPTVAEARKIDPSHPAKLFNQYGRGYVHGHQFKNTLSFSGGSEKASFSSSLGYHKQKGVLPFTWYQDITARLSGKLKLSKKFQMKGAMYYTNTDGNFYSADRFNEEMTYWSPRWDVRDYLKPDGTQKTYGNGNAWYLAATNKFYDRVNRVIGSMDFDYKPLDWLSFNYRIGMDYYMDGRTAHAPGPTGIPGEIIGEDNGQGFINEYRLGYRQVNSNFMVSLNHEWGDKFRTTLQIGHDLLDRSIDRVSAEGDTLTAYNVYELWNAAHVAIDQYKENYRIIGLYSQLTLGYDDFLYLTLTGRNDWTSTLSKNNRSFFYPSASLSYIFSQNIKSPSWLTSGKLRASLAGIGKDADPYSTSNVFVKSFDQPIGGVVGFSRSGTKGFPTLKPERTTSFEVGTDLSFLDDRLGLNFTWYNSHSKDMIIPVLTPSSSGFTKVYLNAGEIRNRGVEITVHTTPVQTQNLKWDVNVNFAANRNKVLSIYPGLDAIVVGSQYGYAGATVTMKYVVGQPVGDLYGTYWKRYGYQDSLHINRNLPRVINNDYKTDSTTDWTQYGFPEKVDSQKVLGNSYPKWTGSISSSLTWKNWNLSFLIDTRQGLRKYDQLNNFMAAFGIAKYTEDRDDIKVFPGVYADGKPNTIPVWLNQGEGPDGHDYGDGYYRNIYRGVSENFVEDASWIRLRSLSLTYNLPKKWLEGAFISQASLGFTGYNLWLHTHYLGFDPETSSSPAGSNANGWSGFTYPAIRSYMFSVNVTF